MACWLPIHLDIVMVWNGFPRAECPYAMWDLKELIQTTTALPYVQSPAESVGRLVPLSWTSLPVPLAVQPLRPEVPSGSPWCHLQRPTQAWPRVILPLE